MVINVVGEGTSTMARAINIHPDRQTMGEAGGRTDRREGSQSD